MKCPNCEKVLNPRARQCTACGTRLIRQSDKMARKLTVNTGIATGCGCLLVALGGAMLVYETILFGVVTALAGILLILLGKTKR